MWTGRDDEIQLVLGKAVPRLKKEHPKQENARQCPHKLWFYSGDPYAPTV